VTDEGARPTGKTGRFEDYPLTRAEYITAMAHFYRGEMYRSTVWRQRLDATTNWAVLTTAGMLSFSFSYSSPANPHMHILLPLTNLIIFAYLVMEARRFRYFAVYRARVRMIEENFLIPIVTRRLESPMVTWREMLAMDLDLPKYKTTIPQAIGFRLRRNYLGIYLIVLGGWLVKLAIHPKLAASPRDIWDHMAVGNIPPGVVASAVGIFYVVILGVLWSARKIKGGEPVDEIAGLESNLEHWKI